MKAKWISDATWMCRGHGKQELCGAGVDYISVTVRSGQSKLVEFDSAMNKKSNYVLILSVSVSLYICNGLVGSFPVLLF